MCPAACLCLAGSPVRAAETNDAQPANVLPWVSDVVKMNDAGIAQDVIGNYIKNTSARSTLTADDIIYLRDHGIPPATITAMIEHGAIGQSAPMTASIPMPQSAAPVPAYAQGSASAILSASARIFRLQPASVVYNNYAYPDYGYSAPYYYNYYPAYYPVWYYPYGFYGRFGFRRGFSFGGGHSFGRQGFGGGGGFHGGGMGGHGGHR